MTLSDAGPEGLFLTPRLLDRRGRRCRLALRIGLTKELQIVLPLKSLDVVDNIESRPRADERAANENNIANAPRHQHGMTFR
jgi:hypothetical protein